MPSLAPALHGLCGVSLVHDSLASTKHGGQCVPALVTLVLCGAECMGFEGLFLFFVCLFILLVS